MAYKVTNSQVMALPGLHVRARALWREVKRIPLWLIAMAVIALGAFQYILRNPSFRDALKFISGGISVTILISIASFLVALVLGLLAGLGRISTNRIVSNLATLYVELVRGVPMLVLIFFIALVGVPAVVGGLNGLGSWLSSVGLGAVGAPLLAMDNKNIPMDLRAITALSVTYGAFLAEVFRAGIQSVPNGQMEAARSQGMSRSQAMRYVILPQAIRNMLPALGNDFISLLKDSSLVSILAVRDITQIARLYAGQTFQYPEAYTSLTVMYLSMTLVLSLLVRWLERRYRTHDRSA